MRIPALALLLAASAFVPPASAQVRQGLVELGGSASFVSFDGDTQLLLEPSVGYFLTDALEAGVSLFYVNAEDQGDLGTLVLTADYHFGRPGATTVPFLGAQVGTSFTDDTDVVVGGGGGAKFFFLPGGAVTAELKVLTGGGTTVGAFGGVSIFFQAAPAPAEPRHWRTRSSLHGRGARTAGYSPRITPPWTVNASGKSPRVPKRAWTNGRPNPDGLKTAPPMTLSPISVSDRRPA